MSNDLPHLQRKVDKWGHEEVLRWLSNVGLVQYADALKGRSIAGPVRRLLTCHSGAL